MGSTTNGSHRLYYNANDNPLYEGFAKNKDASTASAIWKIKKYIWAIGTGGTQVMQQEQYADGNELYDNILDNRASLSYS